VLRGRRAATTLVAIMLASLPRAVPLLVLCLALVAAAGTGCGGGGGARVELLVIEHNILHGIIDEDPDAEPFDRFAERLELIADALAEAGPDVVLLQEVVGRPGEGYPSVRDAVLAALGGEYEAVFGNFLGGPIDAEGLGQMSFTRLAIVASENRSVGGIRSVHHLRIETELGPVDVYNAHLEGTGAVIETGVNESIIEIENVLAFIEETRSGSGPVVLGGDFNAEPDDPSVQRLLQEGYIDALAAAGDATCERAGDAGCTNSTIPLGDNPDKLADQRIDYLFVLPGEAVEVEVAEARLFLGEPVDIGGGRTLWASDHIGVLARLRLRER
jgi:endonuclease/exonuclease/phosphatase family metal-dependent hydrolase